MNRLLVFAYFVESGLLLLVAPWSAFWERNLFVAQVPAAKAVLTNPFVRGAISGIGVLCLWAALSELAALFAERRQARTLEGDPPRPAGV